MTGKHHREVSLRPDGPLRWVLTGLGIWILLATVAEDLPRYQHVVGILIAVVIMAAGVTPVEYRARVRRLVVSGASGLGALAGVVAAASLEEAIVLLADAIVAGASAFLFHGTTGKPKHLASAK